MLSDNDPESVAFDRAYVEQWGLYGFVRLAWSLVEPATPFVDGWHIEEVCNHLEAVSEGVIRRLVINVPPGTSKSITTSVCWPAFTWIKQPGKKWIYVSYSPSLSARDARKCRELVESEWYQARWPNVRIIDHADTNYRTNGAGWRFSTSVRGEVTGRHADIQVMDDPIKAQLTQGTAAVTKTELDYVNNFWDGTMPTRMADPKKSARVIIMQRLHESDLTGHVLETGGYTHLSLPMRFEPENASRTIIGGDRRTAAGELLCPNRYGPAEVAKLEIDLGVHADAQLQQRPARAGGKIFQKLWLKFWTGATLPAVFDEILQSWDLTFKDTLGSDFVCGQVWGRSGADYYLIDRVYERLNFPNTLTAIEALLRKWPATGPILVEDKANGPAVIASLCRKVPGMIPRDPGGRSKVARANAVTYLHRAGNVYYPDPTMPGFEWVSGGTAVPKNEAHVIQVLGFPLAKHDDSVDAETQALAYFAEQHNTLIEALKELVKQRKQGQAA